MSTTQTDKSDKVYKFPCPPTRPPVKQVFVSDLAAVAKSLAEDFKDEKNLNVPLYITTE